MNKLRSYQDRILREFEKSKAASQLSKTALATILPEIYHITEKAYNKGRKRGKNDVIELINNS